MKPSGKLRPAARHITIKVFNRPKEIVVVGALINEQIKASEVVLSGLNGEALGIVSRERALELARAYHADLLCVSLMSSPPPCRLVPKGKGKETARQQAKAAEKSENTSVHDAKKMADVKELRLSPHIEDHDYDTKCRQAEQWLRAGKAVLIVVKASGAKETAQARQLVEQLSKELKEYGIPASGIQSGGKGSQVQLNPR